MAQDGYLVKGWSHLVAGYPRAGKTELLTACCRHWLEIGEKVLYVSEEPRSLWQHRLARFPAETWRGLKLVFGLGYDRADLLQRMRLGQETVIVADTIRGLGIVHTDEKDNSMLAAQVIPWVAAARETGKTLILSHHMRKGDGDHGEGIAGGHALLGTVDIGLEVRHDSGPGRRVIKAYARLIQPAELMYERDPDGTMRALGSPKDVSLAEVRRRVLDALDGDWLKTKEIEERLDQPRPSSPVVREALTAEALAGTVERDPPMTEKAKGKTVRWRRKT